jgi:hypothetical protein
MTSARFLRRKDAAQYLIENYGFGSARTLAKLACISSEGPEFRKAGRIVLYEREALDKWALAKISKPHRSTSDPRRGA